MAILTWDAAGTRKYELGVDHGVLYPFASNAYSNGVAWNGLTKVTQSPDGAEAQDFYADNLKFGSIRSAETFGGTIECYTYPDEFLACNGELELVKGITIGQQARQKFGFSYRTMAGDDSMAEPTDFIIHLVYGATASPSESEYESINDSPEAMTFSYDFDTTPIPVKGHKPVSHLKINASTLEPEKLKKLTDKLYGTESEQPTLPTPDEIVTLLNAA